ncbi:GNAT family N-acetyltransferase [Mariniblastus sp.]|nr:GNAT family N-acetyltransferase [Mariniblastus sp.]
MLVFFKRYRMQFDLRDHRFEDISAPIDFRLLEWRRGLLHSHAEVKFRSFRDELDSNVFPSLGDADGCLKLMRDISRSSNFVPEATWLLVHADPSREISVNCATVQGIMDGPDLGLIQNIGVAKSYRGQGLGSLIVRKSLAGFQSVGAKVVSLEVTTQNEGAIRLYERIGFKTQKIVYKTVEVPDP